MRILLSSDWHLRTTNPENRTETSFFETQYNKIEQILQIASEKNCKYLLQAGDVTDGPRPSFELIEKYVELFRKYKDIKILHVYGQHDMRFRCKERTATKLLNFLGYLQEVNGLYEISEGIHLYGASWGDSIPEIKDKDCFNILLIHKIIIDKPQWIGQDDFLQSDKLFKNNPYDVILAGDNHTPVFYKHKNQTIVGCGCIVRKTIAEVDLKPHVYILDINDDSEYSLEKIELEYKPADEVFKPEALGRTDKKENQKLQEFIDSIKNNEIGSSLNFRKNLELAMKPMEQNIKDIITKAFEEIEK